MVFMDIITGKILKLKDWPDGKIIGVAKDTGNRLIEQGMDRDSALARLEAVRRNPSNFLTDASLADLARECIRITQKDEAPQNELLESPLPYPVWGRDQIDDGAITQMDNAMRLPVTVTGALMPDAHVGYGLPIGGVLATDNVVIPYAVGVDIACRMRLSVYEVSPILIGQKKGIFEESLWNETAFGMGSKWTGSKRASHPVLDDEAWEDITKGLIDAHAISGVNGSDLSVLRVNLNIDEDTKISNHNSQLFFDRYFKNDDIGYFRINVTATENFDAGKKRVGRASSIVKLVRARAQDLQCQCTLA
jgi:hypothetical protein